MLLPVLTPGQEALSITLTTDKQNYDLGQAVLFTVRVQQSGAPVASVVVFFELRDPQNHVMANGFGITDSTGKYSRQIMIGNDFPLGPYTVYVSVTANGQSASTTAVFQTIPEFVSGSMLIQVSAFVIAISMLALYGKRKVSNNVSEPSSLQ
jgi:uncharacterized protein YfaS (alpha-2-macroglobulin family)